MHLSVDGALLFDLKFVTPRYEGICPSILKLYSFTMVTQPLLSNRLIVYPVADFRKCLIGLPKACIIDP